MQRAIGYNAPLAHRLSNAVGVLRSAASVYRGASSLYNSYNAYGRPILRAVRRLTAGRQFPPGVNPSIYKKPTMGYRKKRFSRKRFTRSKRRFARRVAGRRRGRRFGTKRARANKPLGNNFTRNDYRSIRCVVPFVQFSSSSTQVSGATTNYKLKVNNIDPQWADTIDLYSEYYVKDVQWVIQPRVMALNNSEVTVAATEIPYLAITGTNATDVMPAVTDVNDLRQTPGYRYVPLMSKKRIVHNTKPNLIVVSEFFKSDSEKVEANRYLPMKWLPLEPRAMDINLTGIAVTTPKLGPGSKELFFDVNCYATLCLRGQKDSLVPPFRPPTGRNGLRGDPKNPIPIAPSTLKTEL